MRNILFVVFLFCFTGLLGQAPEGFRYQAIVRGTTGEPLISRNVSFRFSIFAGGPNGILVYEEKHYVVTDQFGMVSIIIGTGIDVNGSIKDIAWKDSSHFLKMELDINGGTEYVDMGTNQLLSVPYALYAKTAGNDFSGNYEDLTNKPVTDGSETKIIPGDNVVITGTGTSTDPYIIDGSETHVTVGENLTLEGIGTESEPYLINSRKRYIGEHYGGGIVFYVYDNGMHGLIAATRDQNPEIEWFNGEVKYTNTAGDGVNAGEMNTILIIARQTDDNPVGNFAAKVCADYSVIVDGIMYGDWYLPSKHELNLLFLQKEIIGGFENKYYWSSTEFSSISAWCQHFSSGLQHNINKSFPYAVRAIRSF